MTVYKGSLGAIEMKNGFPVINGITFIMNR